METSLNDIRAALAGKPDAGYVRVLAGDVAAVARGVPADRHTPTTAALLMGVSTLPPETAVYQLAGQVRQLVGLAENREPAEGPKAAA